MIKTVIKIGGSLAGACELPALARQVSQLGKDNGILVVPGGGGFADLVRTYDNRFGLGDDTSHWMGIKAMELMGAMLASMGPGMALADTLDTARKLAVKGSVPVLECFDLVYKADDLPHSWDVTSDSIAAWVARRLNAPQLILLKSMDGLSCHDAKNGPENATYAPEMGLDHLAGCKGVDRYFATILKGASLDVWVVNGRYPERLARLLENGVTLGTRVRRSGC